MQQTTESVRRWHSFGSIRHSLSEGNLFSRPRYSPGFSISCDSPFGRLDVIREAALKINSCCYPMKVDRRSLREVQPRTQTFRRYNFGPFLPVRVQSWPQGHARQGIRLSLRPLELKQGNPPDLQSI